MNTLNIINLEKFKNCCLFSISLRKWGNRAQVKNLAALEEYLAEMSKPDNQTAADEATTTQAVTRANDRVKSNKVLLKSPTYDALCRRLNEVKKYCEARSMPSYFRKGMFVVKAEGVPALEKFLREEQAKIEATELPAFLAAYPVDIELARTLPVKKGGLGPIFNGADYPQAGAMSQMFSLEWYWLALSVPENIPDELKAEAGEKFKRRLLDAAEDIEAALRDEFRELLSHVEERLTPGEDGKEKIFKNSMLGNIMEFIATFEQKNVFGDGELETLVSQTKALLLKDDGSAKIKPDVLREMKTVRANTKESFAAIRASLDAVIETKQKRQFDVED